MDISKVYTVISDIYNKQNNTPLNTNIKELQQSINRLVNARQGVDRSPLIAAIERQSIGILDILHNLLPVNISLEEKKIYERFLIIDLFGEKGQRTLKDIISYLYTNVGEAERITKEYVNLYAKFTLLHSSLYDYSEGILIDMPVDSENLIIIIFQGNSYIKELRELGEASDEWYKILRGFALLDGETDTSFNVQKVEKGSLIMTLSATFGVVYLFAKAADKVLDVIQKYYNIKKSIAEIKRYNVPALNEGLAKMEESSTVDIDKEATEILEKIKKENDIENIDGDINNAAIHSIKEMIRFANEGGEVEVKLLMPVSSDSGEGKPEDNSETTNQIELDIKIKQKTIKTTKEEIKSIDESSSTLLISEENKKE
ncbi:MAG: hypothetical protein R2800_02675 [Flavipsychrobacter sp.]